MRFLNFPLFYYKRTLNKTNREVTRKAFQLIQTFAFNLLLNIYSCSLSSSFAFQIFLKSRRATIYKVQNKFLGRFFQSRQTSRRRFTNFFHAGKQVNVVFCFVFVVALLLCAYDPMLGATVQPDLAFLMP
jgi:hypothetical protein